MPKSLTEDTGPDRYLIDLAQNTLVIMTLLYLPSSKLLHVPSMILFTYFYILATDEKVKNGRKS